MWWFPSLALAALPIPDSLPSGASVDGWAPPQEAPAPAVGIVGGERSDATRWPAVAAIYDLNNEFSCTGTLVAPDLVLTAGHCGYGMETVTFGATDLVKDDAERFTIEEVWVHPETYSTYDVALFRLDRPVDGIEPPALVVDCWASDYVVDDAEGIIVGYGAVDAWATERPTVLHEAIVPLVDADCSEAARGCNAAVLPGGELIAGGDGVDSCSGDSGGPLFLDTPEGLLLAGVTSRAAEPVQQPCGDGGIYVRADAIVPWIETETGATLPRPECDEVNRAPVLTTPPQETNRIQILQVTLTADDPNEGQRHTFELLSPPDYGDVWLVGDRLTFVPDRSGFGATSIGLRITDDGDPPRSTDTELPLQVLDVVVSREPGGCATAPSPWGAPLLLLLGGLSRRRAAPRRRPQAGAP